MSDKLLIFLLKILVILIVFNTVQCQNAPDKDFSLLQDFVCAAANDEHHKNPLMQTIAMVELENEFPPGFSRGILKCLPPDVAKVILNPHVFERYNITMQLTKSSMIIYVADKMDKVNFKSLFVVQYLILNSAA